MSYGVYNHISALNMVDGMNLLFNIVLLAKLFDKPNRSHRGQKARLDT